MASAAEISTVLTKEELDAAIAEVEALGPGRGSIPNLDDGANQVVPIPIPVPTPKVNRQRPAEGGTDAPAATPASTSGVPSAVARASQVVQIALTRPAATPPADASPAPTRRSAICAVLDRVLALINRPFAGLNPAARDVIGLVAAITIVISVLAAFVLPRWMSRSDPFAFVRERRAQLSTGADHAASESGQKPAAPRGH